MVWRAWEAVERGQVHGRGEEGFNGRSSRTINEKQMMRGEGIVDDNYFLT